METIQSIQEFNSVLEKNEAVLVYFSTETCNVCKVLKPKVTKLVSSTFPLMKMIYVKSDIFPEIAAQNRVFAVPTIAVFFAGRETIRKSRAFGIDELESEIERPYSLLFGE